MLCPQEDYSCLWWATPTVGDDQNQLTYQLQIQPLPDEGEEPGEEEYHTLEHMFDISNMKVREGEREREGGGVGGEKEREREREGGKEEKELVVYSSNNIFVHTLDMHEKMAANTNILPEQPPIDHIITKIHMIYFHNGTFTHTHTHAHIIS